MLPIMAQIRLLATDFSSTCFCIQTQNETSGWLLLISLNFDIEQLSNRLPLTSSQALLYTSWGLSTGKMTSFPWAVCIVHSLFLQQSYFIQKSVGNVRYFDISELNTGKNQFCYNSAAWIRAAPIQCWNIYKLNHIPRWFGSMALCRHYCFIRGIPPMGLPEISGDLTDFGNNYVAWMIHLHIRRQKFADDGK